MITLYAVFKQGVYRHECAGIFDDLKKAHRAARLSILSESDDHHTYEIVPFILNEQSTFKDGELTEEPAIFVYRRGVFCESPTKNAYTD